MQRISQIAVSKGPEVADKHCDKRLSDDIHLIDLHTTPTLARPNPLIEGTNPENGPLTPNPLLSPTSETPARSHVLTNQGAV